MSKAREIAVDTVVQVIEEKAYSNIVLNNNLRESGLSDKDKALVTELVYGTIKYKYTIDKILKCFLDKNFDKTDKYVLSLLRVSIYQLKYLDKIPEFAAVNEGVELAKNKVSRGASKFVNGVLRNYLRNKDKVFYNEDNVYERLAFIYSYPQWMIKLFVAQYGMEKAEDILKGLNARPGVTVRVNSFKMSYDEAFEKLSEAGYNIEKGSVAKEAIAITRGSGIESNLLFAEGDITVQDESAMLVGEAMDIKEGLTVMDLCSAPGGKTTHMAELLKNTGKVYAFDIYDHKLKLIESNYKRLGLTNIELGIMDASKEEEKYFDMADRVLIDVPCSGLGIIRKKPEIKYTKREKELKSIVSIQRNIMETASKYVKKGGILLYSTCTVNKGENEENIQWFLKNNKNYELESLDFGSHENILYSDGGCVTILPDEHMDGFFIARLRRKQ